MANNCVYDLKAVSKSKESLERLVKIMNYEDPEYYIYRCFSAQDWSWSVDGDFHVVEITGDVAWSCNEWFSSTEEDETRLGDGWDYKGDCGDAHYITLDLICKELGIGIECWGEEIGVGFQEYYLVNHEGEIVCNECRDFSRIYEDENGNDLDEPIEEGGFEEYLEFSFPEEIYGE